MGSKDAPKKPIPTPAIAPSFPAFMEVRPVFLNVLLAAIHEITPEVGPLAAHKSMALGGDIKVGGRWQVKKNVGWASQS
jgi:hypothetical protein